MPHTLHKPSALHAVPLASARSRRVVFVSWLRKMHGWIGLWGAVLGLLFGSTGILLNHRNILKIPAAQAQESTLQMALPAPAPADAQALAAWVQHALALPRSAAKVKAEPARSVAWGDATLQQPARWSASFTTPQNSVQAEYWIGNSFVTIKRSDNNLFATLSNLHKGNGVGLAWVLLVDTLAASIILLSLSGVLLWTLLNRRRMLGAAIAASALATTLTLALQTL